MVWTTELTETAKKQLAKLDRQQAQRIIKYLRQVASLENPKDRGKALTGNLSGFWRYRVGDYRIICDIQASELVIVAVFIGHRKHIY
ncbi:type II toxin-antitoxin system RelE/ParE family toxin [Maribrevibacterium harenarium]|uniref:Type II toxin-antitoxin system RelE/ParE family toxin n=1 Tax=Maribrevibacterium harenarium TaxID=2589817 RepID=A0A501WQP8_9GAMM|nr:type II toxin-antitoxin system RelE/ParE family toxin [Maribrevibacterium harenarium]TPE49311.1 type II toxin-antitoxin system RelE/ParE family toxin [Maribrevibacterium harenarium]